MYTVKFQAPIENGIVHIPKQYQEIQDTKKATFVVMYEDVNNTIKKDIVQKQLDELDELFANSSNQVQVTMELATNTTEMINDGIL
jgi:hypothetical protein